MTTGVIPGGQPPEPRPKGPHLPEQRREPAGQEGFHVDDRTRSSVITARAAASFEPLGRSVATARSFVRDTLQGWGFGDIVDDAVVLTSELVTNAVVHAGTAADVLCLRSDEGVRIEVADRYPEREIPLQAAAINRSEEHTFELQSPVHLVCRLLLEKKKINRQTYNTRS